MISIEETFGIIAETVKPTSATELVTLAESDRRVLAVDARSDIDIPPFNRVTMDGYAIRSADGARDREVVDYIPAGRFSSKPIEPSQAAKIMTGAALPPGADAVIPVEKTSGYVDIGEKVELATSMQKWANVSLAGSEFAKGKKIVAAGERINPTRISMLASIGLDPIEARARPAVALISTGDELIEPRLKPQGGQIRDSTAQALMAKITRVGAEPIFIGRAPDSEFELLEYLRKARNYDFLIVTGGVSAGDRDFVPDLAVELGYEILARSVAIKPGKPFLFAAKKDEERYFFGLPGNPVSSFLTFEIFVRHAIELFLGARLKKGAPTFLANPIQVRVGFDFTRSSDERVEFIPVDVRWKNSSLTAKRIEYEGSAHIEAFARANYLMRAPRGVKKFKEGELVDAIALPDGL